MEIKKEKLRWKRNDFRIGYTVDMMLEMKKLIVKTREFRTIGTPLTETSDIFQKVLWKEIYNNN